MSITIKTMSELVSVIVPAYNAASRIRPCLESIAAQDYWDIEIIVVDDASADGTGETARKILEASGRDYSVITHESNKGVSSARNTGLENSSGKYICFVDSDDVVRENFVSLLHASIADGKCDVSFCGFTDRFTDGRKDVGIISSCGEPHISGGEKFILRGEVPPVWSCIYRADFLRQFGILFLEGCSSGEDIDFITRAFCRADRVTFVREYLYVYVHHEGMTSIRDNDTREKRLLRYEHNTAAQLNTAEYLRDYAKSKSLRDMAGKILVPQNVIRHLNISAMKSDREGYVSLLKDAEAMKNLRNALSFFTLKHKPEVFMKALMLKYFSEIYYMMRAK